GPNITAHTHHEAASSGSRCYNCHMPHNTFGLLHAMRGHQVSWPTVQESVAYGRPKDRKSTRLNSCHLVISYAVFCLKKKNLINHTHCAGDGVLEHRQIVCACAFDPHDIDLHHVRIGDSPDVAEQDRLALHDLDLPAI